MQETHSKYFFNEQNESSITPGNELIIITDQFSTPENIGSIIRLAANVNAKEVIVLGSEECRLSKIKKTAGAAMGHVTVQFVNPDDFICPEGFTLIALETVTGAKNIYASEFPQKTALVLGNEKKGVSQEMLLKCQGSVFIPMPGAIKSMNVSHAASVCVFEWLRRNVKLK